MTGPSKNSVTWQEVGEASAGQRVDNYLLRLLKGVPKSHIYRILRSGEVRVNGRRVDVTYRLQLGDRVRLPPVRTAQPVVGKLPEPAALPFRPEVLFEDEWLLAINKPADMAVHGGSGISRGVVELLRHGNTAPFIELVHRLDKGTSGVLLLAKKRNALKAMHAYLQAGSMQKRYLALVKGRWRDESRNVHLPLRKFVTGAGERRVSVVPGGQSSHTLFRLCQRFRDFSLLIAELKTGRTHQIRVQLAHLQHPIAGDDKYGDFELNRALSKGGLRRMFLHAWKVEFDHPLTGVRIDLTAPLPGELERFLSALEPAPAGRDGIAIPA
jgi:23S rRNA pseudouridine955/2504/2580 synthase